MIVPTTFTVTALAITATAAVFDAKTGKVPNWLTMGALPIAPVGYAIMSGHQSGALGMSGSVFYAVLSLAGAVLCAAVPLMMYRFAWLGGADVKVLASVGALLTPRLGLEVELCAFLLTAFFVLARFAYEGRLLGTLGKNAVFLARSFLPPDRRAAMPESLLETVRFGPFVFVGTLLVVLARNHG